MDKTQTPLDSYRLYEYLFNRYINTDAKILD